MRTFNLSKIGIKRWLLKREDFIIMPAYQVVLIGQNLSDSDVETFQKVLKIKHKVLLFDSAKKFTEYAFKPEHIKQPYVLYQIINDNMNPDLVSIAGTELKIGFYLYSSSLNFIHNPLAIQEIVQQIKNLQQNFTSVDPKNLDEIIACFQSENEIEYETDYSNDQTQLEYQEEEFIEPLFYLVTDTVLTPSEQQISLNSLANFGLTDGISNITDLQEVDWKNAENPIGIINVSNNGYNINIPQCINNLIFYVHVPTLTAITHPSDHQLQHLIGNFIDAFYAGDYEVGKSQLQLFIDPTLMSLYQDANNLLPAIASEKMQQVMQTQDESQNQSLAKNQHIYNTADKQLSVLDSTVAGNQGAIHNSNTTAIVSKLALAFVGVNEKHIDPNTLHQLTQFILGVERRDFLAFFDSYDDLYQASINNPELVVNVINFLPLNPDILTAIRYGFFISLSNPKQLTIDSNVINIVNIYQDLVLNGYLGQVANLQN